MGRSTTRESLLRQGLERLLSMVHGPFPARKIGELNMPHVFVADDAFPLRGLAAACSDVCYAAPKLY